jgi:ferredoxin
MSEMVTVNFIEKGEKKTFQVPAGTTILEAAHNNNIDLEGACEGSLACSTCHVIVDEAYYEKLNEPSEDEEDMLDLAFGLTPTSRLGCQIVLTKDLDGFTVTVPSETRNVSLN